MSSEMIDLTHYKEKISHVLKLAILVVNSILASRVKNRKR